MTYVNAARALPYRTLCARTGRLCNAGAEVSMYDPRATSTRPNGSPGWGYVDSLTEAARDADLVILTTEWNEFKNLVPADLSEVVGRKQLIDARNVLSAQEWEDAGWNFVQLGRRFAS